MMSHRRQASNKEIPSIWRLTEWWCREYPPWGKMGGGGDCNKLGARAPAAHLPLFIVFHPLHHSVADDRRQRNLHCSSIWHRVPAGRTPSNLRQGLLRPQSEVGDRAGDWRARGTLLINSMLCRCIHSVASCWSPKRTFSPFFRGIPAARFYLPVSVPRMAVGRIPSPDCTPLRSVCQGLLRWCAAGTRWSRSGTTQGRTRCVPTDNATLRYISRLLKILAGSIHRRLANGGVKKSGGASVKNGELSEDERNEMKLIKFFAV